MLFQHGALFSAFSVLDNIAFPLRELKTTAGRADPRRGAGQAADGRPGRRARRTRCHPTCPAA
jgi:ABC-type Fe3+/spermidine/putrescine transport system ATPase subunit